MPVNNWVMNNGQIVSQNHERSYYKLDQDRLKIFLENWTDDDRSSVEVNELASEIYQVDINTYNAHSVSLIVSLKGVTPGGAGRNPNEFRIQQDPTKWNDAIRYANDLDTLGLCLGIYYTDDLSTPIFCAWKLQESEVSGSQKSKQIHNSTISKALISGFAQGRIRNGKFVSAFKKEFLNFYLENANWLHDLELSSLNRDTEVEVDPEVEIDMETDFLEQNFSTPAGINRIYFGAPGTGKSYGIKTFIQSNGISDYNDKISHPDVFRVTLYPDYSYNDFIGQVMPVVKKNGESSSIEYDFVPQVFTRALSRAFSNRTSGQPVFLILEEMSRSNAAGVFGDLFQLLDRDEYGISEYKIDNSFISSIIFGNENSNEKIFLPENLYILGTVNTNDQNVYVMDTAFKRRFEFEYVSTEVTAPLLNNFGFKLKNDDGTQTDFSWLNLINSLNNFIIEAEEYGGLGLTEDKQIGQFFIKFKENSTDDPAIIEYNQNQINGKLIQYLWNDVQLASYSIHRLFKEEITSFSKLHQLAKNQDNFFSRDFLQLLQK